MRRRNCYAPHMSPRLFTPTAFTTTATIVGLVAVGPLATDMYLPAFPSIMQAFGVGMDRVQQTLSLFLLGFALAQLLYGPLSDRFGRKPVLIGGMLLFFISSAGIAFADNIETLSLLRLLQALGGSAGPVLGRAMVRDVHGPRDSARLLSYIGTAMALAPALAPVIGGYMTVWFGWESIFLFLACYALGGLYLLVLRVPETAPPGSQQPLKLQALLGSYAALLRHHNWRWYALCLSFASAGLFAFLSGSPFVIINFLGYEERQYGLFFAFIIAGYMAGTFVSGKFAFRLGIDTLVGYGAILAALSGAIMALLALGQVHSVWAVILPQTLFMFGAGVIMPQSLAGALAPFPQITGTSSSLLGFCQMTLAAGVGIGVGHYHDGSPLSMALAIGAMGMGCLGSYLMLRRARAPEEPS